MRTRHLIVALTTTLAAACVVDVPDPDDPSVLWGCQEDNDCASGWTCVYGLAESDHGTCVPTNDDAEECKVVGCGDPAHVCVESSAGWQCQPQCDSSSECAGDDQCVIVNAAMGGGVISTCAECGTSACGASNACGQYDHFDSLHEAESCNGSGSAGCQAGDPCTVVTGPGDSAHWRCNPNGECAPCNNDDNQCHDTGGTTYHCIEVTDSGDPAACRPQCDGESHGDPCTPPDGGTGICVDTLAVGGGGVNVCLPCSLNTCGDDACTTAAISDDPVRAADLTCEATGDQCEDSDDCIDAPNDSILCWAVEGRNLCINPCTDSPDDLCPGQTCVLNGALAQKFECIDSAETCHEPEFLCASGELCVDTSSDPLCAAECALEGEPCTAGGITGTCVGLNGTTSAGVDDTTPVCIPCPTSCPETCEYDAGLTWYDDVPKCPDSSGPNWTGSYPVMGDSLNTPSLVFQGDTPWIAYMSVANVGGSDQVVVGTRWHDGSAWVVAGSGPDGSALPATPMPPVNVFEPKIEVTSDGKPVVAFTGMGAGQSNVGVYGMAWDGSAWGGLASGAGLSAGGLGGAVETSADTANITTFGNKIGVLWGGTGPSGGLYGSVANLDVGVPGPLGTLDQGEDLHTAPGLAAADAFGVTAVMDDTHITVAWLEQNDVSYDLKISRADHTGSWGPLMSWQIPDVVPETNIGSIQLPSLVADGGGTVLSWVESDGSVVSTFWNGSGSFSGLDSSGGTKTTVANNNSVWGEVVATIGPEREIVYAYQHFGAGDRRNVVVRSLNLSGQWSNVGPGESDGGVTDLPADEYLDYLDIEFEAAEPVQKLCFTGVHGNTSTTIGLRMYCTPWGQ